jgi:hypothetical protein
MDLLFTVSLDEESRGTDRAMAHVVDPTTMMKTVVGLHEDRMKPTLKSDLALFQNLSS